MRCVNGACECLVYTERNIYNQIRIPQIRVFKTRVKFAHVQITSTPCVQQGQEIWSLTFVIGCSNSSFVFPFLRLLVCCRLLRQEKRLLTCSDYSSPGQAKACCLHPIVPAQDCRTTGLLFELMNVNPQLRGSYLANGRLMCRQQGALYCVCGTTACGREMVKILFIPPLAEEEGR